jgi:hypothetical protein
MITKTTKKDFELFKKYFLEYQSKLNLNIFNVIFHHSKHPIDISLIDVNFDLREASIHMEGFEIKVTLIKDIPYNEETIINEEYIKKLALHEVCHLLVHRLKMITKAELEGKRVEAIEEAVVVGLTESFSNMLYN